MKRVLMAAVLTGVLSGCVAPQQPSFKDLDESLATNNAASVRFYPGKSVDEVRKASEKVLHLLDSSDMVFDIQDQELVATRWSTFYAVFVVGFGRDWYSVKFTPVDGGTKAKFGFTGEMHSGMFVNQIPVSFKPDIPVSASQNAADFKLFHDRVEYLLGLRPTWTTCQQAKSAQPKPDKEMALCDSIGLENLAP